MRTHKLFSSLIFCYVAIATLRMLFHISSIPIETEKLFGHNHKLTVRVFFVYSNTFHTVFILFFLWLLSFRPVHGTFHIYYYFILNEAWIDIHHSQLLSPIPTSVKRTLRMQYVVSKQTKTSTHVHEQLYTFICIRSLISFLSFIRCLQCAFCGKTRREWVLKFRYAFTAIGEKWLAEIAFIK